MNSLVSLAQTSLDKVEEEGTSDLVKQAIRAHQQNQEAAACEEIIKILRVFEEKKTFLKKSIREDKRSIQDIKASIKNKVERLNEVDRAWAWAQKSNNFIPLMLCLGHQVKIPSEDLEKLREIPADFEV